MTEAVRQEGAFFSARSYLFVPGDRASEWFGSAVLSAADAVVIDLEDSVHPERKVDARASVEVVASGWRDELPLLIVRTNVVSSPYWREDVDTALAIHADALMIPKATDTAIETVAQEFGGIPASTPQSAVPRIIALVESAAGVLETQLIAKSPSVVGIALGAEDLAADIGVRRTEEDTEIHYARAHIALVCAASGRAAIDTPTIDPTDLALTRHQAQRARSLGFTGKMAIHPRQLPIIHEVFGPTEDETAWAQAVLNAADEAATRSAGLSLVDGKMVDEAVVVAARKILGRSETGRRSGRIP